MDRELRAVVPGALQSPSDLSPANWYKILMLHAFDFSRNFFQLNELAILGFNLRDNALGKPIIIRIDFDFWGIHNVIDIKINIVDVFKSGMGFLKAAFRNLKKTLFSMPDCLFSKDCFNINDAYSCGCKNFEQHESTPGYCEREDAVESCNAMPSSGGLRSQCNDCKGSCWFFHCYY